MNKSKLKIAIVSNTEKILGKKIVWNLLNKRYLKTYKRNQIIFIHIPKAAGTSIANAIYGKRNGHLTASFVKENLGSLFDSKYSFSVSRNPYDRLVSAYTFARQGGTKQGAIGNPQYYQKPIFKTFESFIKNWLVQQDLTQVDFVFQPQHLFVFKNNVSLVDNIYYLEDLAPLEQKLSSILKTEITIGNKNQNRLDQNSYDEYYTPELKKITYQLYQKDFKLFGYHF